MLRITILLSRLSFQLYLLFSYLLSCWYSSHSFSIGEQRKAWRKFFMRISLTIRTMWMMLILWIFIIVLVNKVRPNVPPRLFLSLFHPRSKTATVSTTFFQQLFQSPYSLHMKYYNKLGSRGATARGRLNHYVGV